MFDLIRDVDDIVKHLNKIWDNQGDRTRKRPTSYLGYSNCPCLLMSAVASIDGSYSFVHAVCDKRTAKALVYPRTNKNDVSDGFVVVTSLDASLHALTKLRNNVNMNIFLQRASIGRAERFMDDNVYPLLYILLAYTYRDTRIKQPLLLSIGQAKSLVYIDKNRKSKSKNKKKIGNKPRHTIFTLPVHSGSTKVVREDNGSVVIDINMAYNIPGIKRFTAFAERRLQATEWARMAVVNQELTAQTLGSSRGLANLISLANSTLEKFNKWRVSTRVEYARRNPDEVLTSPTRISHVLRGIRGE